MAQYSAPPAAPGARAVSIKPTFEKIKSVSYNATTSQQIFAITSSGDLGATTTESMPRAVEIQNTGGVPIFLMVGYRSYATDILDDDTDYLHILLPPGETFSPPVRAIISSAADKTIMFGTAVNNAVPNSTMYEEFSDNVADIDETTATDNVIGDDDDTTVYLESYTSAANCSANLYRVGDLIRIRDEIMKVTAIGIKDALLTNTLTVERGMYGSAAVTSATDDDPTRLPFFNAYHDFDRYSVAQTDSSGRFKCFNFFGQGRSATASQGIIPGSVAIKFYQPGYQELGLSGITSSTISGLTAGDEYKFNITVDGGSVHNNLAFTVDSSNTNFGGTSGIISLIQSALDTQYYTAGNLFEKKVTVGIVNGDIRFTSGSHLSSSKIELADPSVGTTPFGVGRIPDIGTSAGNPRMPDTIDAKLPDDVTYDRITYATIPNSGAFGYDDGNSRITGMCNGTINYETGAIDITGCPPNAEFVISCLHSSAFSGKLNEAEADRINSIVEILANTPSQKWNGSVVVRTY